MTRRWKAELCALALGALVAGCGSSHADYCERMMDCQNGNDLDVEHCIVDADGKDDEAAEYDCVDEREAVVACHDDEATCTDGSWGWSDECMSEEEDYNECVDRASEDSEDLT